MNATLPNALTAYDNQILAVVLCLSGRLDHKQRFDLNVVAGLARIATEDELPESIADLDALIGEFLTDATLPAADFRLFTAARRVAQTAPLLLTGERPGSAELALNALLDARINGLG